MPKKVIIKTGATGTSQTSGQLSKIDKAMGAMAKSAGLVAAAYGAIRVAQKAMELGKIGATAEVVESKFQKLIKQPDELLRRMKIASAGTISELKLMQQANAAALLGVPLDQFDDMLTIARSAAQATGESMEFMLTSIVTGIGRGSKLMLDNLGILISQETANQKYAKSLGVSASALTDVQRKQAFANEAVRVGLENVEKAGGVAGTSADSYGQLTASVDDLSVAFGQRLNKSMSGISGYMADIVNSMTDILVVTKEEQLTSVMSNLEVITKQYNITSAELADAEQTRKKQAIATNKVWGGETAQMLIKVRDNYQSAAASSDDLGVSDENLAKKRERLSQLNNLMLADQDEIIRLNKEINAAKKEEAENTEAVTEAVIRSTDTAYGYGQALAEIRGKQDAIKEANDLFIESEAEVTARMTEEWLERQGLYTAGIAGYDTFINSLTDLELSGKDRREKIWEASKAGFVKFLGELVKEKIKSLIVEQLISKTAQGAAIASAVVTGTSIAAAYATPAALASAASFGGAAVAGSAALAASVASAQAMAFAAEGADFTTSGPQLLLVGENPGGRERVQVTPESSPNINGPKGGGITLVFNSPVTNADFVRDVIVPEIERAQTLA
jgi:hypothetical protein